MVRKRHQKWIFTGDLDLCPFDLKM